MKFAVQKRYETFFIDCELDHLYIVGLSETNPEETEKKLKELQENFNIPTPNKIPIIHECSRRILTNQTYIDVLGYKNCGEAEYVIVLKDGQIYIGLGSDHTDMELAGHNMAKSKEIMPKVISPVLWDYEEIKDHFEEIKISSHQKIDNKNILYQQGFLGQILSPDRILQEILERACDVRESVIFAGSIPLSGGFIFGDSFQANLVDDKLGRNISLSYKLNKIDDKEW